LLVSCWPVPRANEGGAAPAAHSHGIKARPNTGRRRRPRNFRRSGRLGVLFYTPWHARAGRHCSSRYQRPQPARSCVGPRSGYPPSLHDYCTTSLCRELPQHRMERRPVKHAGRVHVRWRLRVQPGGAYTSGAARDIAGPPPYFLCRTLHVDA